MADNKHLTVAIVGAGLAGLATALSLNAQGIPCTVYEAADISNPGVGHSLALMPNGQAALDRLKILPAIQEQSITLPNGIVYDKNGNAVSKILLGNEANHGYDGIRIRRSSLKKCLVDAVNEASVPIVSNKKFVRVVSESRDTGIVIEFADGTTATAHLMIGADGIWSRVRRSIYPEIKTQYVGTIVIAANCKAANTSENFMSYQGMYLGGESGTVIIVPNGADVSDFLVVRQIKCPDIGPEGWKAFSTDTTKMMGLLTADKEVWSAFIQDALEHVDPETMFVWYMQILPELESFRSREGRIVLIGDAAHGMPPNGGQGSNQAFEDAWTLGLVLGEMQKSANKSLYDALTVWDDVRRERIRQVLNPMKGWNKMMTESQQSGDKVLAAGIGSENEENLRQVKPIYMGLPWQEEKIRAWGTSEA